MKMINKKIEKELETSINNTISNNSNFFNEGKLNEMKTNVFSSLDFSTLKEKEKSKKKKHVFIFNKKLFLQISVTSLVCLIFIGILSLPFALNVSAGNNAPGDKNPSGEDGSQGIDGEVSESIKIFNNEETFKKELDKEKEKYDFLSNYYVFDIPSSLLDKNNLNITNYYIILSIGDTFKIGDIEFTIIPESDLDDLADGITDNSMEDIKDFDKLDNYVVIPDGQLNGHNVEDDVNIDDLINDERDILGIEENSIEQVVDNCEHNILQNKLISKQILRDFVINECDIILNSELKKQTSLLDILSSEKSNISTKDLAYIVANYNLINNTKVINLLVISMLFKELDSPFFNELEDDGYEKIISTLIRSATTDQSSIERLVLHAVKKYIGEKNESN